jgi:hypothetical protein
VSLELCTTRVAESGAKFGEEGSLSSWFWFLQSERGVLQLHTGDKRTDLVENVSFITPRFANYLKISSPNVVTFRYHR